MKRALCLLSAFALVLLGGCSATMPQAAALVSTAIQLESITSPNKMDAVATLATNLCDAAIAKDYTDVIVARRQALRDLQAKRIDVTEAQRVQAVADQARAALDAACPGGVPNAERIAEARAAIANLKPGAPQ